MTLSGQRVLITGGSTGIGLATARALIDEGSVVAINGRDEARLQASAAELGCQHIAGDVSVEGDAKRIVAGFVDANGGIDVLVNNAGFGRFAPLLETTTEDFDAVFGTNVRGAFFMAREVARHLIDQESGAIVNVASTAGLKGFQGGTAYAASKFALRGMNECWRDELRRKNIRVLLVNPSEVITEFASRAGRQQAASDRKLRPEDIGTAIVSVLKQDPRGMIPELAVFATNPF